MEFQQDDSLFELLMKRSLKSSELEKKKLADYKESNPTPALLSDTKAPVQRTIDLHGDNRREAEVRLEQFLIGSYRAGYKKLKIITGKGTHSIGKISVLKPEVELILRGDRFKIIKNFTPEPTAFGTFGAFIVTLKTKV